MENLNKLFNNLYLIQPEIVISIALVAIVLVDLIFRKDKRFLPYIALTGLIAAIPFVLYQFGYNTTFAQKEALLVIDPLGAFFKLLIILSSILVIVFSIVSKEVKEAFERHGEYYALLFGMIIGMMFMISSSDFIMIYLSLELVSLSSYILAGFTKESLRNSEASLKYVIYGAVASGIMLFGISILLGLTGTTNLYTINTFMQNNPINLAMVLSSILIFVGIGFKISAAPFHFWTPDVYEGAPVTITAYLSIASKAAGFALLIRYIFITFISGIDANGFWITVNNAVDWKTFFTIISILTMTLGNFAALWQENMKRLLAYSSIAHAGYLLLGLAVLSNQGLVAIVIYFAVYAIMNLGAFLVVMHIADKTGSEELEDYRGLGFTSPFLAICLSIFLVSLTGLPPTAGFIGKLYLFIALLDANMVVLAVIAGLNSVVSLYYYVKVLKFMFLKRSEVEEEKWNVSIPNRALVFTLASLIIILGIYFSPLVNLAKHSIAFLK